LEKRKKEKEIKEKSNQNKHKTYCIPHHLTEPPVGSGGTVALQRTSYSLLHGSTSRPALSASGMSNPPCRPATNWAQRIAHVLCMYACMLWYECTYAGGGLVRQLALCVPCTPHTYLHRRARAHR